MLRSHIYLDEDVPRQLGDLLSNNGITVHLPQEIGAVAADDPVHLERCASQGWALVTQNRRDFRRLHWIWMTFHYWGIIGQPHSGIITIREQRPAMIDVWAPAIIELLQGQPSLQGLMYMWRPSSGKWDLQPVSFA
jgi:hypothetical protein